MTFDRAIGVAVVVGLTGLWALSFVDDAVRLAKRARNRFSVPPRV